MRPRGVLGDIALAMWKEASARPGTVAELAQRALIGRTVAEYTASRLLRGGQLVRVSEGRPAVLAAAPTLAPQPSKRSDAVTASLDALARNFWGSAP